MFCVLQFVVAGTSAIHRIESLVPGSLLPIAFAFAWPARGPAMAQTGPGTGPGWGPVEKLEGFIKHKERLSKD